MLAKKGDKNLLNIIGSGSIPAFETQTFYV